jgi:RNA polymerase sigma factor (sigma-70 family)
MQAKNSGETTVQAKNSGETTMQAKTNAAMLMDPIVTQSTTRTLRSFGVRARDMEDAVAEVRTRALEYLRNKPHPATVEEWAALCVTIAKNWRLDEKKKAKAARKHCVGLCEDPDEHTALERTNEPYERVDAKRMVEVLGQQFEAGEMPEKGDEILDCLQAGMDYPETAEELGISAETVRMRLRRMRALFKARLGALGITVMVVALSMTAAGSAMAGTATKPTAPGPTVALPPPRHAPQRFAA